MSASAGTMGASSAASRPELQLWSTSACAALLVHMALAALLLVSWNRRLQLTAAPRGTPNALDVEVTSAPAPATPPPTSASSDSARPTLSALQLKALPEMAALTTDSPPPIPQAAPTPAPAQQPVMRADSLTSIAPLGKPDAAASPPGWLAQVQAQMERYEQYPESARRKGQQDTVRLQFSVDRTGKVTSFHVDSAHHYRALEQEVRRMLQLAGPFPPPPTYISGVIHKDFDFSLIPPKRARLTNLCARPAEPGAAPAGASSTLEQMHTYQDHLQQYVTATRHYVACLAGASPSAASTTPEGNAAIKQLNALVSGFNTQAQEFKQAADLRALQARQAQQRAAQAAAARLTQARSAAERAYAACAAPASGTRPPAVTTLAADALLRYHRRLVAYDAAVHAYVACIDRARQAVLAQLGPGLTAAQRIELEVDAAKTSQAVINPLNQLIVAFNLRLHKLQQQSISTEALARASAVLPDSSWSTPAPLPANECIRITRTAHSYVAQLCRNRYTTKVAGSPATDDPGVARAVRSGEVFVTQAPPALGNATGDDKYRTTSYSVSELRVAGTHVSLTISQRSDEALSTSDRGVEAIHFDLVLSPDKQNLRGQCSTGPRRWNCQLSRHR